MKPLTANHRQRTARGGNAMKLAGGNQDPPIKLYPPARALGPPQ